MTQQQIEAKVSLDTLKLAASVLRGSHEYKRGNAMFVEVVEDLYQAINATELRAAAEQRKQAQKDHTYGYAKQLAEAIFKLHFASDEHYASGRIVWGVNDTVIGILTQIDNMVADMVRKPEQAQQKQEPVAWPHPAAKVVDCDMIGTPIIRAFWPLDIGTELYVSLPKCQQEPAAVVATTNEHQAIVSWRGKPLPHGAHLYTSPPYVTTPRQRQSLSDAQPMTDEQMRFLATAIDQAQQIIDTHNAEFVTARDDLRRCVELLAAHGIKE